MPSRRRSFVVAYSGVDVGEQWATAARRERTTFRLHGAPSRGLALAFRFIADIHTRTGSVEEAEEFCDPYYI